MANCGICGKKIGLIDSGVSFSFEMKDISVCMKCKGYKNVLENKNSTDNAAVKQSIAFLENCIQQGKVDTRCIEIIKSDIEKATRTNDVELNTSEQKELTTEERQKRINSIKKTTGYNFEGYTIVEYKDIISSEIVLGTGFLSDLSVQVNDLLGTTSTTYANKLSQAKQMALDELILNVGNKGGNAVLGIDFDIMTISSNMIVVSASGTVVVIEKIEN